MFEIIAFLCLSGAAFLLAFLSYIDLREGLLPNPLVLAFALSGLLFHACLGFEILSAFSMVSGALCGGGVLLIVRGIAFYHYGPDALGLGDVKLMAAAGVWLGPSGVLSALVLGVMAGIAHGLGIALYRKIRNKEACSLKTLSLPAGPGFALGIAAAGILEFIF